MNSELRRRLVAMGAVGLAIGLLGAATAPTHAPARAHAETHAAPLTMYSLQGQPHSSYGLRLLDVELTFTGTSIHFETSKLHSPAAGPHSPAATSPIWPQQSATGAPTTRHARRAIQRMIGTDVLSPNAASSMLWPENRDSVGAPIVLNERHLVPIRAWSF